MLSLISYRNHSFWHLPKDTLPESGQKMWILSWGQRLHNTYIRICFNYCANRIVCVYDFYTLSFFGRDMDCTMYEIVLDLIDMVTLRSPKCTGIIWGVCTESGLFVRIGIVFCNVAVYRNHLKYCSNELLLWLGLVTTILYWKHVEIPCAHPFCKPSLYHMRGDYPQGKFRGGSSRHRGHIESSSHRQKGLRTPQFLTLLTSRWASRHNSVHIYELSSSKSGPNLVCFVHFQLHMCFAPQRRTLFRHLNFQKCPDMPRL